MLIDAGPLISIVDRRQPSYTRCTEILLTAPTPLISTWGCFTEAMYMVGRLGGFAFQQQLWALQRQSLVKLHNSSQRETERMAALMEQYRNVPMDLEDASLVSAAEPLGDRRIFTLDSDFRIYRFDDGGIFDVFT